MVALAVVEVLLLRCNHLLLVDLCVEIGLGHSCRRGGHFILLPDFARLYRIHGLASQFALVR